jgi:hypothetical protein
MRAVALGLAGLLVTALAACGGSDPCADDSPECAGKMCSSNADCGGGTFECNLQTHMCQKRGQTADAGVTPDAAFDAAPPPTPPDTNVIEHPPGSTQSSTATFTFLSPDQSQATFECKLDDGDFGACTSPKTYEELAEGSHTFSVRAKLGDTVDPSPAEFTWEIDRTAPDTTIASGPSGDIDRSEAAFTFICDDPPCTFQCQMDAAAFAACDTGDSFGGLTLGSHTFHVRAIDAAGNADQTPDSRTFNVTSVTPDTVITSGPGANTNQTDVSFTFMCREEDAEVPCTFVCSLDGAAATACTSGQAYAGLAPGPHTFTVLGTDANHRPDPTAASASFTIDTTRPTVTLVLHPGAVSGPDDVSFTYTTDETVRGFECAIDGAFQPCGADGITYDGLSGGSRTFSVRATDLAGNVSDPATFTWTVDDQGPVVMVTFPVTESGPNGQLTFTFMDLSPPATFRCDFGDGKGFQSCASGFMFMGLEGGDTTLTIEGTDKWGNNSTTTQTFAVDAVGPVVSMIQPQNGAQTPGSGQATFTVAADAVRFTCTVDGVAITPCQNGAFLFNDLTTGSHTMVVTAFDKWDNPSAAPATVVWDVDADPPVVVIDSPANNQVVCPTVSIAFHAAPKPDGSADNILRFQCALDNDPFVTCTPGVSYTLTHMGNPHTVRIVATDQVGNQSTLAAQVKFTIDDFPPTAPPSAITSPTANEIVCPLAPVTYSAVDPAPTTNATAIALVSCTVDGTTPCTVGQNGALGVPDVTSGTHSVAVVIEDACHNQGTLDQTFQVDDTPPVVTVSVTAATVAADDGALCGPTGSITFSVTDPPPTHPGGSTFVSATVDTVACSVGGTTCSETNAQGANLTYLGLSDGQNPHTAVVTVHDACNINGTGNATFAVDTSPPVVTAAATSAGTNTGRATVTFTASQGEALHGVSAEQHIAVPDDDDLTQSCTCAAGVSPCTCPFLAAHTTGIHGRALDHCNFPSVPAVGVPTGASTTTVNSNFGPFSGHVVLIGHDYNVAPPPPANAFVADAVRLAPFKHYDFSNPNPALSFPRDARPVRVLVLRDQTTSSESASEDKIVTTLIGQALNATGGVTFSFTNDPTVVPGVLPGYDVFLIEDQQSRQNKLGVQATLIGPLTEFVDDGGVVVVTDGTFAGLPSNTFQLIGSSPAAPGLIDVTAVVDPGDDDRFFNFDVFGGSRYIVFGEGTDLVPPFFVAPTPIGSYSLPPGTVGYRLASTGQPSTVIDLFVASGGVILLEQPGLAGAIPGAPPPPPPPDFTYSLVVDQVFPIYGVTTSIAGTVPGIDHVTNGTFPVIKPTGSVAYSLSTPINASAVEGWFFDVRGRNAFNEIQFHTGTDPAPAITGHSIPYDLQPSCPTCQNGLWQADMVVVAPAPDFAEGARVGSAQFIVDGGVRVTNSSVDDGNGVVHLEVSDEPRPLATFTCTLVLHTFSAGDVQIDSRPCNCPTDTSIDNCPPSPTPENTDDFVDVYDYDYSVFGNSIFCDSDLSLEVALTDGIGNTNGDEPDAQNGVQRVDFTSTFFCNAGLRARATK